MEEVELPALNIKFNVMSVTVLNSILVYLSENYDAEAWALTKEVHKDGIMCRLYPLPNEEFFLTEIRQDIIAVIAGCGENFSKNN